MKQSNALLAILIGITAVSCSYGMDVSTIGSRPQPFMSRQQKGGQNLDFLSQSTRFAEPDPSEEMYKPLAKPSFLEFYESVNAYLKNKNPQDLTTAKDSLRKSIDTPILLTWDPYVSFLNSNTPDQALISKLKTFLNASYFEKNKGDLCKAIPYFLKNITRTDQNTIDDTLTLLEKLKKTSDPAAETNIKKIEREIRSVDTNIQLTDDTLRACWDLLDEVCNVIPREAFQRASHDLVDSLLMALLHYNGTPDHNKYVIDPAIDNIDTLIDFISKQKRSEKNTRITQLKNLKARILKKTKDRTPEESTLSREDIKEMINSIENITQATLKSNDMMESTLQLEQIQQEKEEFEREQERFAKEQEKASDMLLFTNPKYLMDHPDELLSYMNRKNWDSQTKTYALQLLFWFTQKEASGQEVTNQNDRDSSLAQRKIIQSLRNIVIEQKEVILPNGSTETVNLIASAPGIVRKRGYKAYPRFTFDLQQLPEDAPDTLKELFNLFKKQELENQRENPDLAIKTYAKDIQEQKEYLAQPYSEKGSGQLYFEDIIEEEGPKKTNLQQMTETAEKFYQSYVPSEFEKTNTQLSNEATAKLLAQVAQLAIKNKDYPTQLFPILVRDSLPGISEQLEATGFSKKQLLQVINDFSKELAELVTTTFSLEQIFEFIISFEKTLKYIDSKGKWLPNDIVIERVQKFYPKVIGLMNPNNRDKDIMLLVGIARLIFQNEKLHTANLSQQPQTEKIDHSKRISEKFAASLSTKQTEMEELIQQQVDKLSKQITETDDVSTLKSIASQLDNYKLYVSESNHNLQESISNAQNNTAKKILAHEPAQVIKSKLALFEKAINSDAPNANVLTSLVKPLEGMKKDPSISLAQTSEIRALMVTAKEKLRGSKESPQEKTITIKETIAKEVFDNVTQSVKEHGTEWLFKKENYDNFPNDLSLACLFEIIEILVEINRLHVEVIQALEPKNSAPYAAIISQLNDYITQSIIPAKIDIIRSELIPFVSNIPALMQQQKEKEIKEYKELLDKQAQEAQVAKEKALAEEQKRKRAAYDKMIAEQARELEQLKAAKIARDAQAKTVANQRTSIAPQPTTLAITKTQPPVVPQQTAEADDILKKLSPEVVGKIESERARIGELVKKEGFIILCDPTLYEKLPYDVTSFVWLEALLNAIKIVKEKKRQEGMVFPATNPLSNMSILNFENTWISTLYEALEGKEFSQNNIYPLKLGILELCNALKPLVEKPSAPETPSTPLRTFLSYINAPINFVINILSGITSTVGSWFSWLMGR